MSRFIPYARKYFESEEWQQPRKFSEQEAWLDMIFLASFADHTITLSKGESLTLYRGEFYYTQRQLAKRWGWDVAKVNRYFARLAEGTNPRIQKILRETQNETQSETQVETQITVVRLCNYASYNELNLRSETQSETQSETGNETLNNKGDNNKGDNNTHTHFKLVKDLFVQACTNKSFTNLKCVCVLLSPLLLSPLLFSVSFPVSLCVSLCVSLRRLSSL